MTESRQRSTVRLLRLVVVGFAGAVFFAAASHTAADATTTASGSTHRTAAGTAVDAASSQVTAEPRAPTARPAPWAHGYDHASNPASALARPGEYRSAPNTAARIGDDVVRSADDAFSHGYSYHPRIRARGVQDPVGHNFPYSFDDVILRSTPVRQADGSLLYRGPGSINNKDGFFEIALNPDTGTIFHRTFVGG